MYQNKMESQQPLLKFKKINGFWVNCQWQTVKWIFYNQETNTQKHSYIVFLLKFTLWQSSLDPHLYNKSGKQVDNAIIKNTGWNLNIQKQKGGWTEATDTQSWSTAAAEM